MRNLLTTLLLTAIATTLLIPWSTVAASQLVADPNDFFQVYTPAPEDKIIGIGNVSWKVVDSDTQEIPYNLYLKDIATCGNVLRTLVSGTVSSTSTILSTSWNSTSFSDGLYCLELCVNLSFVDEPYITCNARAINIQNTQSPKPAPSPIVVSPPKPAVEQPVVTAPKPNIIIISPGRDAVFSGDQNTIRWQLINPSSIVSISIYYSPDQKAWTKIADPELVANTYDWDVTDIESTNYFLKIVAKLNNAGDISVISPVFKITSIDSQQTGEPVIYDLLPSRGSEIRDSRPLISGKFLASVGEEIVPASFEILIDGLQRSDSCEVSTTGFKCQLEEELDSGAHLLDVSISDSSGQTATQNWEISISLQADQQTPADSTNILGQVVGYRSLIWIVMICCALLFLIIVPWLLYRLWRNRDEQSENVQEWNYYNNEPLTPTVSPSPNVEVNYVYPETIDANTDVVEQTNQELSALGIAPQENQENGEPSWLVPEATSTPNNITVNVINPGDKHKETGSFGYASKIDE